MSESERVPEENRRENVAAADDFEDVAADVANSRNENTIEALEAELEASNERLLRTQAELENFRKRARRELDEQRRYANLPLIAELLPAIDNLSRAAEAAAQNESGAGLVQGVQMVADQMLAVLAQYHCRPIEAEGSEFDPNVHEAIAQEPSNDVPAGVVTRVVTTGYQLHDRVVRPAHVMVSTGPAAESEPNE